jgi:hypothetical protein
MAYGLEALADYGWDAGDDELIGAGDPLSIRLNNPGAIRRSGAQWPGMRPEQTGGFVDFETPEDGIRAMSRLLDTYNSKHGLNTISGVIGRWAPPSENDTRNYAAMVAKALGVSPDQPVDMTDQQFKAALIRAMSRVEAGRDHYTPEMISAALAGQTASAPKGAKTMPMPPDMFMGSDDEMLGGSPMPQSQGLASLAAPRAAPQSSPLAGLSPYMQLAAQLSPQRGGSAWGDAAIAAGAAMLQSQSPNFGVGLGAGLQAGNQAYQRRADADRTDIRNRFQLGMDLAKFDQKDAGEYAMSDGVLYNKKTGTTQNVGGDKPLSDAGKLQADLRSGRITPEQYDAQMARMRGEGESPVMKALREAGIDPQSPDGQKAIKDYIGRIGGGATVNIDNKVESEFAKNDAKRQAATYGAIVDGASEAIKNDTKLDRLNELLDGVQTGRFATTLLDLQKGLVTILGENNAPRLFGKPPDVAQAEAAKALSSEIALMLRNPAGGAGMPGAMSDADREFLAGMVPGLGTTPEGRALMTQTARALNKRAVDVAKLARDFKKSNGGQSFDGWETYLAEWAEKNPLFTKKAAPAAPSPGPGSSPPQSSAPQAPPQSLRVETPSADGIGTTTRSVPIQDEGSIPRDGTGQVDRSRLRPGAVYFNEGRQWRWNGQNFMAVEGQ